MECKEEIAKNLMVIMQEANLPIENLNLVRNKIFMELDKYEVSAKCTELSVVESDSEKYIKLYLAMRRMEGLAEKTIAQYAYILNRFRMETGRPVIEMSTMEIRVWLAKTQQEASLRTCSNYRNYLSSFYAWLFKERIIEHNPFDTIDRIKYEDKVKQTFSEVDVDNLRSACANEKERAILELLLSSGARVSELSSMNREDIDLASLTVIIRHGKGSKQRVVYIGEVAREHLLRYLNQRKDNDPWLFVNKRKGRLSTRSIELILNKLGEKAKINKSHPHRCRITYATVLCKRGMDISTLQTLMGHSSANTTRGYINLSQDHTKNQYARYA